MQHITTENRRVPKLDRAGSTPFYSQFQSVSNTYTHVHTHTHTDKHVHPHTQTATHKHTHTHQYQHTHTHTHTLVWSEQILVSTEGSHLLPEHTSKTDRQKHTHTHTHTHSSTSICIHVVPVSHLPISLRISSNNE